MLHRHGAGILLSIVFSILPGMARGGLASTPNPTSRFDEFFGVTHVPGTHTFWAVGSQGPARPAALGEHTLSAHCTRC